MKSILLVLSLLFPSIATSQAPPPDIKQQIIQRCRSQMESFGASMVKFCVDEDLTAYKNLMQYDNKHQSIIRRCEQSMLSIGGWSMVKFCADEDITAQQALDQY